MTRMALQNPASVELPMLTTQSMVCESTKDGTPDSGMCGMGMQETAVMNMPGFVKEPGGNSLLFWPPAKRATARKRYGPFLWMGEN